MFDVALFSVVAPPYTYGVHNTGYMAGGKQGIGESAPQCHLDVGLAPRSSALQNDGGLDVPRPLAAPNSPRIRI